MGQPGQLRDWSPDHHSLRLIGDKMYYVYLIVNNSNDKYIGYTSDLKRRLREHQKGSSK